MNIGSRGLKNNICNCHSREQDPIRKITRLKKQERDTNQDENRGHPKIHTRNNIDITRSGWNFCFWYHTGNISAKCTPLHDWPTILLLPCKYHGTLCWGTIDFPGLFVRVCTKDASVSQIRWMSINLRRWFSKYYVEKVLLALHTCRESSWYLLIVSTVGLLHEKWQSCISILYSDALHY